MTWEEWHEWWTGLSAWRRRGYLLMWRVSTHRWWERAWKPLKSAEYRFNHPEWNTNKDYPVMGAPRSELVCRVADWITLGYCHD